MPNTRTILNKLSSSDHMPWDKNKSGYVFQSKALAIKAGQGEVWSYVRDPNSYDQLSQGAIWAHVNGEVKAQSSISFKLLRHQFIGLFIPQSYEVISVVDDTNKIIGWERKLPLGLGTTQRYQVLEPKIDGDVDNETTMSYIALRVPGVVGFFTHLFLKGAIEESFNSLSEGIKDAAEKSVSLS